MTLIERMNPRLTFPKNILETSRVASQMGATLNSRTLRLSRKAIKVMMKKELAMIPDASATNG